jgi:hypothetical protein
MKKDDWRIYGYSGRRPLPREMQEALDRYMENLKAEQRRKYPHLLAIKFPPQERGE